MTNQLVSVCIPIYNGEKYISRMLESIINQTYKNIEIIVSDNCSTDSTCEIVNNYMTIDSRIKLNLNNKNLGYSGNLNKLIELATAEYIAVYHADDLYESTIIQEEINFLLTNPDLAGCFSLGKLIDCNEKKIKNTIFFGKKRIIKNSIVDLNLFIENMCKIGNMFLCPTSMIKKSVYKELFGYNINLRIIEDQDMWIRILEKYKLGIVAQELFNCRIHINQGSTYYSNRERQNISMDLEYLEKYLNTHISLKTRKNCLNINKRLAKDYLVIARNFVSSNNYEQYTININESVKRYRFKSNLKFFIFQNLPAKLSFKLIKLLLSLGL